MSQKEQPVMKCPKCRYGMVYRYKNKLECKRCGKIFEKEKSKSHH